MYSSFVFYFMRLSLFSFFFFFNDTATTEIYTLSLHDALPISARNVVGNCHCAGTDARGRGRERDADGAVGPCRDGRAAGVGLHEVAAGQDRKSTRLNSSHGYISYAVFCLKKKKTLHSHRPPC